MEGMGEEKLHFAFWSQENVKKPFKDEASQLILSVIVVLRRKKINSFLMNHIHNDQRKILTAEVRTS